MFGFWILAVFANNLFVWVLFDYAVASYFLFVAGASWWFTVKNTWEEEGGPRGAHGKPSQPNSLGRYSLLYTRVSCTLLPCDKTLPSTPTSPTSNRLERKPAVRTPHCMSFSATGFMGSRAGRF